MIKDEIIAYFNSLDEVKRIKELEPFIDSNPFINEKLKSLNIIKKKMTNSKEFNLVNQYKIDKLENENIKKELFEYPFVEEYIELLEIVDFKLVNMINNIESDLNRIIND